MAFAEEAPTPASPQPEVEPAVHAAALPSVGRVRTVQLLAGAGTTAVAVPAGLYLGSLLGSLSNNLILAALPAAAAFLVLPAVAVTLVEWAVGNHLHPGSMRLQPALWVALGTNLLSMVGAMLLGVSVGSVQSVALFTLVECVVLPSAVTGVMAATAVESPLEQRRPPSTLRTPDARPLTVNAVEVPW